MAATVFGFHGCDQSVFDKIIKQGGELDFSPNDYDWLGSGIYFWENSVDCAWAWARASRQVNTPAVIGDVIDLGHCLDLTDKEYATILASEYQIMKLEYEESENDVIVLPTFLREVNGYVRLGHGPS